MRLRDLVLVVIALFVTTCSSTCVRDPGPAPQLQLDAREWVGFAPIPRALYTVTRYPGFAEMEQELSDLDGDGIVLGSVVLFLLDKPVEPFEHFKDWLEVYAHLVSIDENLTPNGRELRIFSAETLRGNLRRLMGM